MTADVGALPKRPSNTSPIGLQPNWTVSVLLLRVGRAIDAGGRAPQVQALVIRDLPA